MPSWGRSFVVALKAMVVGFLLGLLIMIAFGAIGYTLIFSAFTVSSSPPYFYINPGAMIAGIIIFAVGGFLSGLTMYASLIKYTIEESVKETEMRGAPLPPTPSPAVPTKTCPKCGKPVAPDAPFCANCGAKLA